MSTYRSVEGQNIYDLALQLYGTEQEALRLIRDSPDIDSFNNEVSGGSNFEFNEEGSVFRQFTLDKKINVATNDDTGEEGKGFDEGFDLGFN